MMVRNLTHKQIRVMNFHRSRRAGVPVGTIGGHTVVSEAARRQARPNVDMLWLCCRG